ncbi:MAG: carboxypeptidase-like regulatory domain-containing protein, partial [Flavobacteriales bacterium]
MKWSFPTLMVSLLLLTVVPLNAQEGWRLQGTVLDAVNADPLPGAAVFLDGNGVLTDLDGRFTFTGTEPGAAPSVLRVRYIGYVETSQSLDPWTGDKTLEVRLEPDVASIGTAVVSAGRYEQDLGEVSVSIDVLPPELVNQGAPTSADQSLSRTPGVTIVDSEPQIRGGSGYSFGAGSRVAVLLDGLPVLSGDAGRPTWGFLPLEN